MKQVVFVLSLLVTCTSQASPLPVFVLAGQSNMSGWGVSSSLAGELAGIQERVYFHQQGAGFGFLRPFDDDFGPEISFGHELSQSYETLGIVKHALGSTSLAVDWNPDTGPLYQALMTRVDMAKTYWASLGFEPQVKAVVWMQGEQDSRMYETAATYEQNFRSFITRIKSDLGATDFVYGQISAGTYPYRDLVREAQVNVAISGSARFATTDDLATYEGVHFTTESQLALGRRLARQLIPAKPGDADWDGDVDLNDLNIVRNNFGSPGLGDIDHSGQVDLSDLNSVRNNFGQTLSPVPEPSSLLLLTLLVPTFLLRR